MAFQPQYDREAVMVVVCQEMADGQTLRAICRNHTDFPHEATIRTWAQDDEYATQYARAREALLDYWADEITEDFWVNRPGDAQGKALTAYVQAMKVMADNKKWVMSKLSKKYAERVDVTSKDEKLEVGVMWKFGNREIPL